jgi:hypothetical protein
MAMRYEFTVDADGWFPNKRVDLPRFELEIRASSITVALDGSPQVISGNCCVDFKVPLAQAEVFVLEGLVKSHTGDPLPSGAQQVEITAAKVPLQLMPASGRKANLISINWCDPTTWWPSALAAAGEVATTNDPARKVWSLAHQNVIDVYHGKITGESNLPECRVKVTLGGVELVEQDPHYGSGGDFVVGYVAGTITLSSSAPANQDPVVDYYYEHGSRWVIPAEVGEVWRLKGAECQFSDDIGLRDSTIYEVWITDPSTGQKVMADTPDVYKTMADFINDANKAYPAYPAFDEAHWRGSKRPVYIFAWDFQTTTDFPAAYGAELHVRLEHDQPHVGTFATGTFYYIRQSEG